MPAPLLYTGIGAGGIGDGSQRVFGVFLTDGGHEGLQGVLRDIAAVPVGTLRALPNSINLPWSF